MSIKNKILDTFKNSSFNITFNRSYSQEGEDLILNRIFNNRNNGFYVDIGSFHPVRFSNTFLFYKKGWRGITIDARPDSSLLFKKLRPNDISLEIPINDIETELVYYMFNEPALNGFSKELTEQRKNETSYKLIKEVNLKTKKLEFILDNYLPNNTKIDFLTVDVEGLDLNVLRSNNWEKYRPDYLLTEDLNLDLSNIYNSPVSIYLASKNYSFFAKTVNTIFYRNNLLK